MHLHEKKNLLRLKIDDSRMAGTCMIKRSILIGYWCSPKFALMDAGRDSFSLICVQLKTMN